MAIRDFSGLDRVSFTNNQEDIETLRRLGIEGVHSVVDAGDISFSPIDNLLERYVERAMECLDEVKLGESSYPVIDTSIQ